MKQSSLCLWVLLTLHVSGKIHSPTRRALETASEGASTTEEAPSQTTQAEEASPTTDSEGEEGEEGGQDEAKEAPKETPKEQPKPKPQNSEIKNPRNVQKKYPALGYDLAEGPQWNIVCITKNFGRIPGKLNIKHQAFFTYQYDVYSCERFFKINGVMLWNEGEIPENCYARGKQKDNEKPLYNIVAVTQYGNIPGKASSKDFGIFSHEGIRFTTKSFYWVC